MGNILGFGNSCEVGACKANEEFSRPFSKKDREFLQRFLPSFVDIQGFSTHHDQEVILKHWEQLFSTVSNSTGNTTSGSPMIQLFDTFYSILFEVAPAVKPLFRSSMQVQGRALIRIVGAIKNMLAQPDMTEKAAELARRHVTYGVKCEYFDPLCITLIRTLSKCSELGRVEWTDTIKQAWRRVAVHVSLLVIGKLHIELYGRPSFFKRMSPRDATRPTSNAVAPSAISSEARCPFSGNKLSDVSPGHK